MAYYWLDGTPGATYTDLREEQSEKAQAPMEVTLEGMETEVREEQPLKAQDPMEVTLEGMEMAVREVQL